MLKLGALLMMAVLLLGAEAAQAMPPGRHACPGGSTDLRGLASQAYVWGYPLVRAAQLRENVTLPEDPLQVRLASAAGAPINRLGHARELATPETRVGVAPNNDTLYSLAWLDTNAGPFVFEAPDFGDRFYTFQMGQGDTTTDLALGQRTHGRHLPPVFIHSIGDRTKVPRGMTEVRSKQRHLMIAGRTLVTGRADLPAAHRLQDAMRLRLWSDYRDGREVVAPITPQETIERRDPPASEPGVFLQMLGVVLKDWRPEAGEIRLIRSFAPLGLSPGKGFDPACLRPAELPSIAAGFQEARAAIESRTLALGASVNGWTVNYGGARFGNDWLLRAAVAMDQIYVLPAEEALYMTAKRDGAGKQLDGNKSYLLHFTKDELPPVRYFWSATMYFAKGLMVPNEIDRFSIGDRASSLNRNANGSIDILMQHERPADADKVNWLPTPSEPFTLMLRLYGPKPQVRERKWSPPPLLEIDPH